MKLHLPTPRLLPFTIATLAVVLALKTVDLAHRAVAAFDSGSASGMAFDSASAGGMVSRTPVPPKVTSAESPAMAASLSKIEFSDAISLSTVVVRSSADASGADVSAAATANPPTTAILRISFFNAFHDVRRR